MQRFSTLQGNRQPMLHELQTVHTFTDCKDNSSSFKQVSMATFPQVIPVIMCWAITVLNLRENCFPFWELQYMKSHLKISHTLKVLCILTLIQHHKWHGLGLVTVVTKWPPMCPGTATSYTNSQQPTIVFTNNILHQYSTAYKHVYQQHLTPIVNSLQTCLPITYGQEQKTETHCRNDDNSFSFEVFGGVVFPNF